jgi:integrase
MLEIMSNFYPFFRNSPSKKPSSWSKEVFAMSRKGENIYKRKDGRWEGRYLCRPGAGASRKYTSIYGQSYTEVKQKLLEARTQETDQIIGKLGTSHLFKDILHQWLASRKLCVKESTYVRYYSLVTKHIEPELGFYKVEQITRPIIEKYIHDLLTNGRLDGTGGLSQKTVADILIIIKEALAYGVSIGAPVCCQLGDIRIKKKSLEMRVLSSEEQKRLNLLLFEDIDTIKLGVLISLYAGLRVGEVCALQWKHIDPERGMILVRQTMQRIQNVAAAETKTRIVITEPKSACSQRDIPIPAFLVSMLRTFQAEHEAYVLTGRCDHFIEPRTMQNHFKRYVRQCGIAPANYHALRHSFATRCIELGFDVKSLSEILGHSNVNTTLNRYVHSSLELKRENMEKLCSLVSE